VVACPVACTVGICPCPRPGRIGFPASFLGYEERLYQWDLPICGDGISKERRCRIIQHAPRSSACLRFWGARPSTTTIDLTLFSILYLTTCFRSTESLPCSQTYRSGFSSTLQLKRPPSVIWHLKPRSGQTPRMYRLRIYIRCYEMLATYNQSMKKTAEQVLQSAMSSDDPFVRQRPPRLFELIWRSWGRGALGAVFRIAEHYLTDSFLVYLKGEGARFS
jgi:hypothetical protein